MASLNAPKSPKHITILDPIRGLAALAVCIYHFTGGEDRPFLGEGHPLSEIAKFGYLGVEVFFFISGFIIPYAMFHRQYRISESGKFITRRLKRLEPPYLASIALIIGISFTLRLLGSNAQPMDLSWQRILSHLGYLCVLTEHEWLNAVYWTLAIEFQFYIFIALAFPLLVYPKQTVRFFTPTLFASTCFLNLLIDDANIGFETARGTAGAAFIFYWLPIFAAGMVTFQLQAGLLCRRQFFLSLPLILIITYFQFGPKQTFICFSLAILLLATIEYQLPKIFKPLIFLGTISYSVYLIHGPIGGPLLSVLKTRTSDSGPGRMLLLALVLTIVILASSIFWKFIEKPSQSWAKFKRN